MSELISRQAAIDAVGNMLRRKFGIGGDLASITLAGVPSAQPTVDAVSVVRCKDCIHNHVTTWNHGRRDKPQCHFTDLVRSNEFFCGFGERRGE